MRRRPARFAACWNIAGPRFVGVFVRVNPAMPLKTLENNSSFFALNISRGTFPYLLVPGEHNRRKRAQSTKIASHVRNLFHFQKYAFETIVIDWKLRENSQNKHTSQTNLHILGAIECTHWLNSALKEGQTFSPVGSPTSNPVEAEFE